MPTPQWGVGRRPVAKSDAKPSVEPDNAPCGQMRPALLGRAAAGGWFVTAAHRRFDYAFAAVPAIRLAVPCTHSHDADAIAFREPVRNAG